MKRSPVPFYSLLSIFLLLVFTHCNNSGEKKTTTTTDSPARATATLTSDLRTRVVDSTAASFEAIIAKMNSDPLAIQWLAHYAYLDRQLETAAWLYALADEKKPGDPNNQSNLGLVLHEIHAKDPSSKKLLQDAISLLEKAATGQHAAANNNLGYAYYQLWLNEQDRTSLEKAKAALNRSIEIDPKNATAFVHLADVLKALGETEPSLKNLDKAFQLDPFNGVLIASARSYPEYTNTNTRTFCDSINFECMKNCPPSIIGRIKIVNCEIAQQDARTACREGKPYAISYNCDDEAPSTGFMIPGLQSGFGIITPWGKIVVMLQGGGQVDVKVEANSGIPGVRFTAAGSYDPASGMSEIRFGTQASVNLYNQGVVAPVLNKFNIGPAGIKVNAGENGNNIQIESYDTPVVAYH
jgi:tetratricopeptide (TPR) repeat protein